MSGRATGTVWSSFDAEARGAFEPVARSLGLEAHSDPERVAGVRCLTLDAEGAPVRVRVCLALDDLAVETTIFLRTPPGVLRAALAELVVAAGLGARQHVSRSAATVHSVRKALRSQADWLVRIHPLVAGPDGPELARKAGGLLGPRAG